MAAFEAIVGAVAHAYDRWSKPVATDAAVGDGPAPVTYTFDIGLDADTANGGRARVDVYADADVPAPEILIEPATYTAKPVTPGPEARYAYAYLRTGTTDDWLPYEQALEKFPDRTVGYAGWDVFAVQNARASVHVVRNKHLVPDETTTATFEFQTPEVQFAGPVVPLLAYPGFDLGTLQASGTLESYLDLFFESLLSEAAGQTVAVKLAASYAYRLTSAIEDFPETVLAVSLLPPTEVTPATGPPAFVAPFAAQVSDSLATQGAIADGTSRYSFALEVFAGGDPAATLPLLTVRDLTVATSAVTPPGG